MLKVFNSYTKKMAESATLTRSHQLYLLPKSGRGGGIDLNFENNWIKGLVVVKEKTKNLYLVICQKNKKKF